MALYSLRLRRSLSLSSSLLHRNVHLDSSRKISTLLLNTSVSRLDAQKSKRPVDSNVQCFRFFRSSPVNFSTRRQYQGPSDDQEIGPDTILFEGCDYNHWLITIDFPKDEQLSAEQMVETYVQTAAKVFGSVEEAKKRIYACSTTTYQGFQVECTEETSEKFQGIPGVVFILPDSYIDPVNKEYGGDKYINGTIIPRPPPIQYRNRREPRNQRYGDKDQMQGETRRFDRPPRENNDSRQGPPTQQNYGLPQGPPTQQNYGPPQGPPPQQNYGPPQGPPPTQQNYGPPQGPSPTQQNYGPSQGPPPTQQNYGPPQGPPPPPTQQNYGLPQGPPARQNYGPPTPQSFGLPQGPPARQNYGPPTPQSYGPPQGPSQQYYGQTQGPASQQSHGLPQDRPFQQNYGPSQGPTSPQNYGPPPRVPSSQQNYSPPPRVPQSQQHYGPPPPPQSQQHYGPPPPHGPPHQQNFGLHSGPPQPNNETPPRHQNYSMQEAPARQNYAHTQDLPHQQNFSRQQNYVPEQKYSRQELSSPEPQRYSLEQNVPTTASGGWDRLDGGRRDFQHGDNAQRRFEGQGYASEGIDARFSQTEPRNDIHAGAQGKY